MPYVNIKITKEGATQDQKARLIKGATDLLVDVLGKNPATTVVVIDEGSTWTNVESLEVGVEGAGSLTVLSGGRVRMSQL